MSHPDDQPTQQIRRPDPAQADPPTRPLPAPGPLDLTRPDTGASSPETEPSQVGWPDPEPDDGVAALDAMMGAAEPQTAPSTMPEAETWTPMPVVPVRSDTTPASTGPPLPRRSSETMARVRADATEAFATARRWTRDWFGVHDNALGAMTGAIAILLIIIVALLGH